MSARTSPFETKVASFAPKPKGEKRASSEDIDRTATLPRREDPQANIGKVTLGINCAPQLKDRFKALCKQERYNYAAMLDILMDNYEQR